MQFVLAMLHCCRQWTHTTMVVCSLHSHSHHRWRGLMSSSTDRTLFPSFHFILATTIHHLATQKTTEHQAPPVKLAERTNLIWGKSNSKSIWSPPTNEAKQQDYKEKRGLFCKCLNEEMMVVGVSHTSAQY